MNQPHLFDRERRLVSTLRELFAWRERFHREIEQAWEVASSEAEKIRSELVEQAERRFQSDSEGIELEAAHARQRIDETITPELQRLRNAKGNAIGDIKDHHAGKVELIRKERDESIWLAETVYDSDESQSRKRHRSGIEGVDAATSRLNATLTECASWLKDNRWQRWLTIDLHVLSPRRLSDSPDTADQHSDSIDLEASVKSVELLGQRLIANTPLRATAPLPWAIGTAVLLVLIAGAALVLNQLQWTITSVVAPIIGLVVSIGLWGLLRFLGRRRLVQESSLLADQAAYALGLVDETRDRIEQDRLRESTSLRERRDKEMKRAHDEFVRRTAHREDAQRLKLAEVEQSYAPKIEEFEQRAQSEQQRIESRLSEQQTQATQRRDGVVNEANRSFDQATVHARAARDEGWKTLGDRWNTEIAQLDAEAEAIESLTGILTPEWERKGDVASWSPPRTMSDLPGALLGSLHLALSDLPGAIPEDERLRKPAKRVRDLPVAIDLLGRGSVIIRVRDDDRPRAFDMLRASMLRLLTLLPPAKARFTLIDPIGLGQNFAGFMHLADHLPALVGDRIWTEPRHIEQRLADLTEHMEQVIQKYLRNEYPSLDAYNQRAGEIAEPYRFLVIADFPTNITDNAAHRLASIATSGARCGVHMLILANPDAEPPRNFDMAELERASIIIAARDGRFLVEDQELSRLPFCFEPPPPDATSTALLHKVGAAASDASRVEVPFSAVSPSEDAIWTRSAAEDVRVPLGRTGATKLQELVFGRGTAQHALVAGKTGSGKSTLLHVLITNLAMWFSPSEVEFYLVDFKKGVEFKTYATHRLPHARVVAVETDREFGLSVLRRLDEELKQRAELFRGAGVQDLAGYRSSTGKPMPRTLLIIDEFQELFTEDDRIAQDSALLLDRIVRQGRAFGVHVVLGSQTLGGAYTLNRATMGQMNVRIALQCSEADSYLILSEDNAAARLLSRPGEAIYNDAGGLIEGNSPFQIVWLPESVRDTALEAVARRTRERMPTPPPPPVVFEGGAPADIRDNKQLQRHLTGDLSPPQTPVAYLGEPISIRSPIGASFRRQGGANLLIVGQQDETATALIANALLSLSIALADRTQFTLIDPTPPDSSLSGVLRSLAERCATPSTVVDHSAAEAVIAQMHAELTIRQTSQDGPHQPRFLFINGLHRVRPLRRSEDEFSFGASDPDAPPKPDRMLAAILSEGPSLGVHVIAWGDTLTTIERCFDRSTLREFEQRVLLQMSATDSASLIDSPAASRLGLQRAIFYTEESPDIERFRPYALLDASAIDDLLRSTQPQ